MLLFNKQLTASEACTQGLVTEVFADSAFQGEVWTRLKAYAKLPKNVCNNNPLWNAVLISLIRFSMLIESHLPLL